MNERRRQRALAVGKLTIVAQLSASAGHIFGSGPVVLLLGVLCLFACMRIVYGPHDREGGRKDAAG